MANIRPGVKHSLQNQLPDFIRSDYQTFLLFLQKYYEFLETTVDADVSTVRDMDEALDKYVSQMKKEMNYIGKSFAGMTDKTLLPQFKDLYLAKGSESSYKTFFRLLFKKESEIFYPSTVLFKTSDGVWQQDVSCFIIVDRGDAYQTIGKEVTIVSGGRKTRNTVSRVRATEFPDVLEMFFERLPYQEIFPGSVIKISIDFKSTVQHTTNAYSIVKPGEGFVPGQLINISSGVGRGTQVKISSVHKDGGIKSIKFIKFGFGYENTFTQSINSATKKTRPFSPYEDFTDGFEESGLINEVSYFDPDYADGTYVGNIIGSFFNSTSGFAAEVDKEAVIEFKIGGKLKYQGYYVDNRGFTSNTIYLQDSKYYQIYSYVVKVEEQLKDYKNYIKSYIHPAGFALFADFEIKNKFSLNSSVRFVLNAIRSVITEQVRFTDEPEFSLTKGFHDTFEIIDEAFISQLKFYADSFNVSDAVLIQLISGFLDSFSTNDSITFITEFERIVGDSQDFLDVVNLVLSKGLQDTITFTESASFGTAKYLNESFTNDDAGSTHINYYTAPDYWNFNYSEGAQSF